MAIRTIHGLRSLVALGLLALAVPGCSPRVYEIRAAGAPEETVNFLFLGDGFTEAELPTYRAATYRLTQELLATAPFCRLKHRINVYRIDVVDDTGRFDSACTRTCSNAPSVLVDDSFVEPVPLPSVRGRRPVLDEDFQVTRCRIGGSCLSMWPTDAGVEKALEVASHAPDISVVVILVNSQLTAGNGFWEVRGGPLSMAVSTLPMTKSDSGSASGEVKISPAGYHVFLHELGHALGLVDETTAGPIDGVSAAAGRNVWMPDRPGPWDGTQSIPWQAVLEPGCGPETMRACCGRMKSGRCEPCSGVDPAATRCAFVPAVCQVPELVCPGPDCVVPATCADDGITDPRTQLCRLNGDNELGLDCSAHPAAWEGGGYEAVGTYRSSWRCRMGTLGADAPFCPACATQVRKFFCERGECDDLSTVLAACP